MSPLQVKVWLNAPAALATARGGDQPGFKPVLLPIHLTAVQAVGREPLAAEQLGGGAIQITLVLGHGIFSKGQVFLKSVHDSSSKRKGCKYGIKMRRIGITVVPLRRVRNHELR
jgi:hypothetical protein